MGRLIPPSRRRLFLRLLLLIIVPLGALFVGGYYYTLTGRYVVTDNAYVKARKLVVSSDISGRVVSVAVADNQLVKAGEPLFELDAGVHQIALQAATADIADVRRRLQGLRGDYREAVAELKEAKSRQKYYRRQVDRFRKLSAKGVARATQLEEMEQELTAAAEQMSAIRERMNKIVVGLGGSLDAPIETHPWYLQALAKKDRAELDLADTVVAAPISGAVSNLTLEPGEFVTAGRPVFTIVDQSDIWIEANLKETQLTHVTEGQEVSISLDAYPDAAWTGIVHSISPATGAEFSVLPPQNASGNWVKVVQRVPVRLAIEGNPDGPPLRAGMTATVEIDTKRQRDLLTLYNSALAFVRSE